MNLPASSAIFGNSAPYRSIALLGRSALLDKSAPLDNGETDPVHSSALLGDSTLLINSVHLGSSARLHSCALLGRWSFWSHCIRGTFGLG